MGTHLMFTLYMGVLFANFWTFRFYQVFSFKKNRLYKSLNEGFPVCISKVSLALNFVGLQKYIIMKHMSVLSKTCKRKQQSHASHNLSRHYKKIDRDFLDFSLDISHFELWLLVCFQYTVGRKKVKPQNSKLSQIAYDSFRNYD